MNEFSQQKNDEKTKEEAKENLWAALGSLGAVGLSALLGLPAEVAAPIAAGLMGAFKTLIRRIRNRRKHQNREE